MLPHTCIAGRGPRSVTALFPACGTFRAAIRQGRSSPPVHRTGAPSEPQSARQGRPVPPPATYPVQVYGIFAAGFVTRPLGALLFGWIGDRYSRKTALLASIYLMSVPTFLMGCLPTYSQVGLAA